MPRGYKADGTPNNPTGKGLVHDGRQGIGGGMAKKAGQELTRIMCDILMEGSENGKPRVENMCRAIMKQAETGDVASASWFSDRVLGKPTQQVNLANHEGGPLDELMDFLNGRNRGIPSDTDTIQ